MIGGEIGLLRPERSFALYKAGDPINPRDNLGGDPGGDSNAQKAVNFGDELADDVYSSSSSRADDVESCV